MKETFDPQSAAEFEWERWATLRGKRMYVFRYAIQQDRSAYSVAYGPTVVIPRYTGLVYIDRETYAVMRISLEVTQMPTTFPISHIWRSSITTTAKGEPGIRTALESSIARRGKALFKNDVEFRNYNRLGAEATITCPRPDSRRPTEGRARETVS